MQADTVDIIKLTSSFKMAVPPWAPAETKKKTFEPTECTSAYPVVVFLCDQYLVDGKSDGEELGPLVALHPATFLHQSHDHGAGRLAVLGVVVLLGQLQPILRVRPESVCETQQVYSHL